jgi:6-phosphofructokinase 2
MSSIITITLNPAIDKTTSVDALVPDKKMKCTEPSFEPGGGGINVARAIKKLGGEAKAIFLAGGYSGNFFRQLLAKESVESFVIEIDRQTRENLTVFDKQSKLQYRFGMPGPLVSEKEWKQLLAVLEKIDDASFIVASGSVPEGVPEDIYARISIIAKKKNAKFIVDTSGNALKHAANQGTYLLKPNLAELSTLADKEWIDKSHVAEAAKEIISKGKTRVLVVSMGEKGAMLFTGEESKQITPPLVERKSTVGAGDSMVAGIVISLSKGKSLLEAAQYGVACGTAATMNPGTELCRLEDAEKLYTEIRG